MQTHYFTLACFHSLVHFIHSVLHEDTLFSLTQVYVNMQHSSRMQRKKNTRMIFIKYPKYVLFPSFGLTVCSYAFSLAATVCNLAPRSHLQFAIAKIQCPLVIICKHGQHHQCGWQKFLACNILGLHRKYLIVFNCTKKSYFSYD